MKKRKYSSLTTIEPWMVDPEQRIDRHTIASAFELAGLWQNYARLTAASQRLVFGFVPFGKAAIYVGQDGIRAKKTVCFGTDCVVIELSWPQVEKMVASGRKPTW